MYWLVCTGWLSVCSDKKRQNRLCRDTEGSRVKQKLGNEQNDVRDDIGETRVVVESAVTSLINKGFKSGSTCVNYTK